MRGTRVLLEWMVFDPYPQRARPARANRLAAIVDERDGKWIVRDGQGEEHVFEPTTRRTSGVHPREPQWVIKGPLPAHAVGDRVQMSFRERNLARVEGAPPDFVGEVIDEDVETIHVRAPDGARLVVDRVNGHERGVPRQRPRWVVIG